jgi:hypothetical protein
MSTEPGSDPIGDFQRWLMRAGARSIGREVAGRVRSTIGSRNVPKNADVWETATTEELTDEPPECQWCPICRAARRYRDSGGTAPSGPGSQFAGVGDTLAGLTRDAFSLFDAALRASQRPASPPAARPADPGPAAGRPAGPEPAGGGPAGHEHSDHGAVVVGPGIGWPTVVHSQHEDDEAADEGGDRQEGGEPGDGGPDGGTDQQVERTAE